MSGPTGHPERSRRAVPVCEGVRVRTSRQRLLLSALAAATVLLTGTACATSATAAAIVGDTSISEQTIFDRTADVSGQVEQQNQQQLTLDQLAYLNRAQTTAAIRSALLEQVAQDHGVIVTDSQVNAAMSNPLSGATGGGADPQVYRDQLRLEGLLAAADGQNLPFTDVKVTIDGYLVPASDDATRMKDLLESVPAGGPLPVAGSSATPLPQRTVDLLTEPASAWSDVLAARPGQAVILTSNTGYFVIRVVDRTELPGQVTTATILATQDLDSLRAFASIALLQQYAQQVGVTVNPRMGVWDPVTLQVVPADGSS